MIKILFLIPNLGHGGAEKVLVNLVNNMDKSRFDITVMTLYDEGVNKEFLSKDLTYRYCFKKSFRGVAHVLKVFSPTFLYKCFVKEHYDIAVSYLEGQTARIISGCADEKTKKVCWIHKTMQDMEDSARLFRNEKEARKCYSSFDRIVSVSKDVQQAFMKLYHLNEKGVVAYNTNLTEFIVKSSKEPGFAQKKEVNEIRICAMGSLVPVKGFERLINVHAKIREKGFNVHTYILGEGPEKKQLQGQVKKSGVEETLTFLGYQTNPYAYLKQCDLFVCSSYSEGFSTAVTEALVLGVPVVTTKVSGMEELLGANQEYGVITDNNTEALLHGIERLLSKPEEMQYYQSQAEIRGREFTTKKTVENVQNMLAEL